MADDDIPSDFWDLFDKTSPRTKATSDRASDNIWDLFKKPEPVRTAPQTGPAITGDRVRRWAATAFDAEVRSVADAPVGKRNGQLNTAAYNLGQLVGGGHLDSATVIQALTAAAHAAGLDPQEIGPSIGSGMRAGRMVPRPGPAEHRDDAFATGARPGTSWRSVDGPAGVAGPDVPGDDRAPVVTGWELLDLTDPIAGRDTGAATPTILSRHDGTPLIYPGKVHAINGEPESGKTWLALLAVAEQLGAGHRVLYVDFEDDARTVVHRLQLLGVPDADIGRGLGYVRPDTAYTPGAADIILGAVRQPGLTLVILDGVTEAMNLHGWAINDNDDVATFYRRLPRPLAQAGPAVVLIDHVTKAHEGRGRYAIGGQHKLAGIDGAVYSVEVKEPFAPGRSGSARVTIGKDRPGEVRRHLEGRDVGTFRLTSTDTAVTAILHAPTPTVDNTSDPFARPIHLMQRMSEALEAAPTGLTATEWDDAVPARAVDRREARRYLDADGYTATQKRGTRRFTISVKPYRVEADG